jgi:hypothetical protein
MMDEEQFKATIILKYQDHFDHYYRLHQLAQTSLVNYRAFTKTHYETALQYNCRWNFISGGAYASVKLFELTIRSYCKRVAGVAGRKP